MILDEYTERHGNHVLSIHYDETPSSPRGDTNLATIIGWDRGYILSDDGQPSPRYIGEDYTPLEWWRSYIGVDPDEYDGDEGDNLIPTINGVRVLFAAPLRLDNYGSSGVRLHIVRDDDDHWDRSSGVIFVTEDDWNTCMGEDHPKPEDADGWVKLIEGEVQTYKQYLNGEVYGYVVEKVVTCDLGFEHRETVDSCWGYYDTGDALSEGRVGLKEEGE